MNNEQRIQQHNLMVRAQLRAELDAQKRKRSTFKQEEARSRQINCVQNRTRGQSEREKWGVNNHRAVSDVLTPSRDHVDAAPHKQKPHLFDRIKHSHKHTAHTETLAEPLQQMAHSTQWQDHVCEHCAEQIKKQK